MRSQTPKFLPYISLLLFFLSLAPFVAKAETGITPATGTILNSYSSVTSILDKTITVDSTTGFSDGNTALLIQMKGSTVNRTNSASHGDITDYGTAGRFEFVEISTVNAGSVELTKAPTIPFDVAGSVQLIRVASFTNNTLTGTISGQQWNGTTGGVVAIDATGTLTLSGTIDVTGLGFKGGALATGIPFDSCLSDLTNYTGPISAGSGNKGEGIVVDDNSHRAMRGHNANGGGGGNITDAAGGGGGNFGAGGIGGRELDMCDDGAHGGQGGQALDYSPMNRMFLGGGGGSGSEVAQTALGGARTGGGIVLIRANKLIISEGEILANGLTSNNDDGNGADGGGAGGTVVLVINDGITGVLPIEANGGNGGDENNTTNAHGPGGGGGAGGVILLGPTCSSIEAETNAGEAGISYIGSIKGDPNWGAEAGQEGQCIELIESDSEIWSDVLSASVSADTLETSSISGTVFKDNNNNDSIDPTETGMADISLWIQKVNADGSLNPLRTYATSNALGNYQFDGNPNGNYKIFVDLSDPDIDSDRALGGTNPIDVALAGVGVSNIDFPFDEIACVAFTGEVNEISLPITSQLKTSDKLFIPSTNISPIAGHLRAYTIDADGQPSETEAWDAASKMTTARRTNKLFSTDSTGKKIKFELLDAEAFSNPSLPVTTIKAYTINPSTDSGAYLAGRENGSFLGGISAGNDIEILSNKVDPSLYLSDLEYRGFYDNTVVNRTQRTFLTSDDGFLYAFNQKNGQLSWAWMPRSLAPFLSDYSNFQNKHLMDGKIDVLDLKTNGGVYGSYVVGSYKSGLGHYVLKVAAKGGFAKVVWDRDLSNSFISSPNKGKMEFFKDTRGKVYGAHVLTDSNGSSKIFIRSLVDKSVNISITLDYQATSSPFVMHDYGRSNAPAAKTLYLGTSTGDIHSASLLDSSGNLLSTEDLLTNFKAARVTEMDDNLSGPVLHIGASASIKDNRYYLTSQTAKRLTVHKYTSSDQSWNKAWTSYSSGAGKWDESGTYTSDNSGVPSDKGGYAIVPPEGIQSLPVDTNIDAPATIVSDSIVLPISVLDQSSTTCYGKAYLYFYSLSEGTFPKTLFFNQDNSTLATNVVLGYGEAKQLSITDMSGTDNFIAYGLADKKNDLSSGIAKSFIIKDPITTGLRGWKEIGRY